MGRQENPDKSSTNPTVWVFVILLMLIPFLSIAILAIQSDDSTSSATIPKSSSTTSTNPPPMPDGFISQSDCDYEMKMMLDRVLQYGSVKLSDTTISYDGKLPADADPRKTLQVTCSLSYVFQLSVNKFSTSEQRNTAALEFCSANCRTASWDYKGFSAVKLADMTDTIMVKKGNYMIMLYTNLPYPQNNLTQEGRDLLQKNLLRWAIDEVSLDM